MIKNYISTFAALIGGMVSTIFGGWSAGMTTLVIFMAIDYISGKNIYHYVFRLYSFNNN